MLPLLCLSAPLCAQATHLVGPGGLPQIRDALAIAAPGDVIHVAPGTYAHFTCDVGVTIRALLPDTVSVMFDAAFLPPGCDFACMDAQGPTRFELPAGQTAHVVGVRFVANVVYGLPILRHRVTVSGGTVGFDDCTISAFGSTALSVAEATVHLQNCVVAPEGFGGVNRGLVATDAHVIAVDTDLSGGVLTGLGLSGEGVVLNASTLKASGCALTGGTTSPPGGSFAPALSLQDSRVWISDSTLSSSGCAIAGDVALGQMARTTITSGSTSCVDLTPAPLVGVERPNPIQNGAAFDVLVHTEPNTLVAIHASPRLAHVEIPGLFAQPIALDLTSFFLAGLFVSDGSGDVTASWNMPAGQFVDQTIWLEATAWLPAAPILVGPVVGGVIR